MKILLQLLLFIFPWRIRKCFLKRMFHFSFEKNSRIGFSIILANRLELGENAYIGHLNFCKAIDKLSLGANSSLGNLNFITGFSVTSPIVLQHGHFSHIPNRKCVLEIGEHVGVTSRHFFDCNGGIFIHNFVQIAGFGSCFMTHSIDPKECRQDAEPIIIGQRSFIGSQITILKGAEVPDCCIIGARSLLTKKMDRPYSLYAGVPAKYIKDVSDYQFFNRETGFVR